MLAEMTAAQVLQLTVTISTGVVSFIAIVIGWIIALRRSAAAHADQKAEMRAEVSSISVKVDALAADTKHGFSRAEQQLTNVRDLTRQSLDEGTRRMNKQSENIRDLKLGQAAMAQDLASVKGQLGIL